MKLKNILTETIDNLFNANEKRKYAKEIWNIIEKSYEPVGGIKTKGFSSIEDMIQRIEMWKVFRINNDIKAVVMYKDKKGRKMVAMATDGTPEGKNMLRKILYDDYRLKRSYSEVSGPALKFIQRMFSESELKDLMITTDEVISLFPEKEIRKIDDYHYEREIGGVFHEKMMLGKPNIKFYKK